MGKSRVAQTLYRIYFAFCLLCGVALLMLATHARADVASPLRGPLTYDPMVYRYIAIERPDGTVVCIRMDVRDYEWQNGTIVYKGLRIIDDACEPPRRRRA